MLVLNSPSNPWGCVYSAAELEALSEEVYRAKAFVVSDDIYWRVTHPGVKAPSFASVCPDRTVVIDGLSKWGGAAGWRLGVAAFGHHPDVKAAYDRCVALSSQLFSCVCLPVQHAAATAFSAAYDATPEVKTTRKRGRRVMQALHAYAHRVLRPHVAGPLPFPKGGYYLFLPFPRAKLPALAARGVGVVDGHHFGMRGYIRVSLTQFDGAAALASELPALGFTRAHVDCRSDGRDDARSREEQKLGLESDGDSDDAGDALEAWVRAHCPVIHQGLAHIVEVLKEDS